MQCAAAVQLLLLLSAVKNTLAEPAADAVGASTMHHALQHMTVPGASKPWVLATHIAAQRPEDNEYRDVCPDVGQGATNDLACASLCPRSRQHLD